MNYKKCIIASAVLALSTVNAFSAEMNAGTIHFTGEIIAPTCEIDGGNGTDSTIPLGYYLTSEFKEPGDHTELVPFRIKLKDCPLSSDGLAQVQLTFDGKTELTSSPTLLDVSAISTSGDTAATGVGIAISLKGADTTLLPMDGSEGNVYIDLPTKTGDTIEANFNARYQSFTETVTAGPADADMTVNILYR